MSFYSALDSRTLESENPTLFEIISSNELADLLTPSLRFVLVHYTHKYPKYLLKIYHRFDEINLVVRGVIEYYFLKKWNSTFTEKFYGLKRSSNYGLNFDGDAVKKRLSSKQVYGTLVYLLGVPYIKEKLDRVYEKYVSELMINDAENGYKKWFVKLYPMLNIATKIINIVLSVLYLSNNVNTPSIATLLLKTKYSRLFETQETESASQSLLDNAIQPRIRPLTLGESINEKILAKLSFFRVSVLNVLDTVFPFMMFSLKFLEWWQQDEYIRNVFQNGSKKNFLKQVVEQNGTLPVPQVSAEENLVSNKYTRHTYDTCAICKDTIKNATVIETGFVFCHECINDHLSKKANDGRCPITGQRLFGCRETETGYEVTNLRKLVV